MCSRSGNFSKGENCSALGTGTSWRLILAVWPRSIALNIKIAIRWKFLKDTAWLLWSYILSLSDIFLMEQILVIKPVRSLFDRKVVYFFSFFIFHFKWLFLVLHLLLITTFWFMFFPAGNNFNQGEMGNTDLVADQTTIHRTCIQYFYRVEVKRLEGT